MKTERLILSFVALLIGLGVAGAAFYFYQSTKVIKKEDKPKTISILSPTPTPDISGYVLTIDSPKDEEVVSRKTITISGKTASDATVIITTETDEQVISPAKNGNFNTTQTIIDGANILQITAVFPDGGEKHVTKTVCYTSESF